jgi:hypothetical protein
MTEWGAEDWKAVFEGIQSLGLVAAGAWAIWRFERERVDAPQIAFSVDVNLHGPSEGDYAAEYVLPFQNKGKTCVQVNKIELLARVLWSESHYKNGKKRHPGCGSDINL